MKMDRRTLTLGVVLLGFGLGLNHADQRPAVGSGFRLPPAPTEASAVADVAVKPPVKKRRVGRKAEAPDVYVGRYASHFASSRLHTQTHASSLVELNDGRIRAFWFTGSREGAADVTINTAIYDPAQSAWSEERVVVRRENTQRALHRYVGKLGNPVVARAADGTLQLFYVTVSVGGWAGSSITVMQSTDEGESWSEPRRLVTSPFLNISTLVKGTPFLYADGTLGLPVYHESFSKFAEILHLDQAGRVIDKQRLTRAGQGALQPVVLVKNRDEAVVLTRFSGRGEHRVLRLHTADGGQHWSAAQASALRNPDAALTGTVLNGGQLLAVLNEQDAGRDSLSLMVSEDDGASWRELHRLEEMRVVRETGLNDGQCMHLVLGLMQDSEPAILTKREPVQREYLESAGLRVAANGGCNFEFSYPYLIQARNGDLHLSYTWNRVFIKHLNVDPVWLGRRLKGERQ